MLIELHQPCLHKLGSKLCKSVYLRSHQKKLHCGSAICEYCCLLPQWYQSSSYTKELGSKFRKNHLMGKKSIHDWVTTMATIINHIMMHFILLCNCLHETIITLILVILLLELINAQEILCTYTICIFLLSLGSKLHWYLQSQQIITALKSSASAAKLDEKVSSCICYFVS